MDYDDVCDMLMLDYDDVCDMVMIRVWSDNMCDDDRDKRREGNFQYH